MEATQNASAAISAGDHTRREHGEDEATLMCYQDQVQRLAGVLSELNYFYKQNVQVYMPGSRHICSHCIA